MKKRIVTGLFTALAVLGLGIKVAVESRAQIADVHVTRRAWCETGADDLFSQLIFLQLNKIEIAFITYIV